MLNKIKTFYYRVIWDTSMADMKGARRIIVSLVRVVATTINGIINKRILVQASSLSYATLLATGPILAIAIMFSSMFFKDKGEKFFYEKIVDVATFVMPAFNQMLPPSDAEQVKQTADAAKSAQERAKAQNSAPMDDADKSVQARASEPRINPQILDFINTVSKGSAGAGAVGIITMLITCVLLCVNMESAFNHIWGVSQGRNFVERLVFYFTLIFFGSVGTTFGMTFLATSHLSVFVKNIPFIAEFATWITYILGLVVITLVLAFFYQFIPCAKVRWKAAFVGAIIVMALLLLNNKLSFLYISYIVKQQSFYGYFAIVAVAMFSLYVFWVVILSGGLITYSVQYVDLLSDDEAWHKMGRNTQRITALAVFAVIARAFTNTQEKAPTVEFISSKLRLPKLAVMSAVRWLQSKDLVCATENSAQEALCYKPCHSLESSTLGAFMGRLDDDSADTDTIALLARAEPAVEKAVAARAACMRTPLESVTLKEIVL